MRKGINIVLLYGYNEEIAAVEETTEITVEEKKTDRTDNFNKRMAILQAFFDANSKENLEAQLAVLSDTIQFSSPRYGSGWQGKEAFA